MDKFSLEIVEVMNLVRSRCESGWGLKKKGSLWTGDR